MWIFVTEDICIFEQFVCSCTQLDEGKMYIYYSHANAPLLNPSGLSRLSFYTIFLGSLITAGSYSIIVYFAVTVGMIFLTINLFTLSAFLP